MTSNEPVKRYILWAKYMKDSSGNSAYLRRADFSSPEVYLVHFTSKLGEALRFKDIGIAERFKSECIERLKGYARANETIMALEGSYATPGYFRSEEAVYCDNPLIIKHNNTTSVEILTLENEILGELL